VAISLLPLTTTEIKSTMCNEGSCTVLPT
jgi:hypothetical protein